MKTSGLRDTALILLTVAAWLGPRPVPLPAADVDVPGGPLADARNIRQGWTIPDENYCDQPYVVVTRDGNWVCLLTTGRGKEGAEGEHVVATISADQGKTWSPLIDIEPGREPVSAYVTPFLTPYGRIYAFYDFNGDNFRSPKNQRVDELGWYVYRYSDDGGRSWSRDRFRLPMRLTAVDRNNTFHGAVQLFWGVGKPIEHQGTILPFSKMAQYVQDRNEGWFFRSGNILTERDPAKLNWELLPEGDHGVRADEFGTVQEEHNLVPLNNGDVFCVYRTTMGYPCQAFSHDGGRTWTHPEPMTYTPGDRVIKHPRACPPVWKTSDGRYLFWFHNNGNLAFRNRNPAWITGGIEINGKIHWSQPEILLYDDDPAVGMSYPCLVEQSGKFWMTETNKTVARVYPIDRTLLEGLWSQGRDKPVAQSGLVLSLGADELQAVRTRNRNEGPRLAQLAGPRGFSLDMVLRLDELAPGQTVLDTRDPSGRGVAVATSANRALRIRLSDGAHACDFDSDAGVLSAGREHRVTATFDAGPRILMFVVDGVLCDGGPDRPQGFTRVDTAVGDVNGEGDVRLRVSDALRALRVYDRPLRTSEAVSNHRASQE
jgi:hypothetical protein